MGGVLRRDQRDQDKGEQRTGKGRQRNQRSSAPQADDQLAQLDAVVIARRGRGYGRILKRRGWGRKLQTNTSRRPSGTSGAPFCLEGQHARGLPRSQRQISGSAESCPSGVGLGCSVGSARLGRRADPAGIPRLRTDGRPSRPSGPTGEPRADRADPEARTARASKEAAKERTALTERWLLPIASAPGRPRTLTAGTRRTHPDGSETRFA
jgi:hypothetical protein